MSKVHIEYLKSISSIFKEKKKIFKNIPSKGWAILNNDDEHARTLNNKLECNVMTYGINSKSDVEATDLQMVDNNGIIGMNFKIRYDGNVVPVFLPDSLGLAQVYAFLAGAAVSIIYGFNLVEISICAKNYIAPRGRTNLIYGINDSYIIDDTYNSSPSATRLSINLLLNMKDINNGRTIAVLGDMLELGTESESLHKNIGKYIVEKEIDMLFTIGKLAKNIHLFAEQNGLLGERNKFFSEQEDLISHLQLIIQKSDNILIKGSQGARMEKIVKKIMKNPGRAKELLVRQSKDWI